jgi:hypothetical protein
MFARVCIRSPNVCTRLHTSGLGIHGCAYFRTWDPSRELHRVPSRGIDRGNCIESRPAGDCIMLARSALITRWNSNQVPWDPSRELHRVPARRGLHHAGPVGVDHSMELQPGPLGSKVVHTSGPWIHGCAYFRPMDPWLCILPAHGSKVVHHAGPWIQGCASCWPMDPRLCIESRPAAPTSTGPHGID